MSAVKPFTFQQLISIVRHSYGYTKQVNLVNFLVNRVQKLAPWAFPLGILGAYFVYPAVPDRVKWEYSLPYNAPKTNIKLNAIPVEKDVEANFN